MQYPQAKLDKECIKIHNLTKCDEYYWMQNKQDPKVREYISQENQYVTDKMKDTEQLQKQLYQEMRARLKETDESVKTKYKNSEYFTRALAGKEYTALFRVDPQGQETCLLDGNIEAMNKDFWDLGEVQISASEKFIAYSTDETGDENYTLHIKDNKTNQYLAQIANVAASGLVFEANEKAILYVRADTLHRPYQVCRYWFDSKKEEVIFQELDEKFFLSISLSRDEKTVYIHVESKLSSELQWRTYQEIDSNFQVCIPRTHNHIYEAVRYQDYWMIRSNREQQENFAIYQLDQGTDFWSKAELILVESPDWQLDAIEEFQDFILVLKTGQATNAMDILWHSDRRVESLDLFSQGCQIGYATMYQYDSHLIRLSYSDPIQPQQIWEINVATKHRTLLKEYQVQGEYDPNDYQTERRWYESQDGVKIPATLIYHKNTKLQDAPVYLAGYGAYGIPFLPTFSQTNLSLLHRGVIVAIAHIRGGGDLGKYWHIDGRLGSKIHTFEDFIAVAEGMCKEGLTQPAKLIGYGGSAGGLLIGAVMNMRPNLFGGMIADVPFVDTLNTMLNAELPLTVTEYEEWGNPNQKESYEYISAYAPYENIIHDTYPKTLAIAGLNDPRVMYWEPLKWIARLRAKVTNPQDMMCYIYESGHSGVTGRYASLKETAFRFAFVLKVFGLHQHP